MIKQLYRRVYNSPTWMTWANFGVRVLSIGVVLPLALRNFAPEDIAFYFLVLSALMIQFMGSSGFTPTIARSISHAMAGARKMDVAKRVNVAGNAGGSPNLPLVSALLLEMRRLFVFLGGIAFLFFATLGTWLIFPSLQATTEPDKSLLAWIVVVSVSPFVLWSHHLNAFLQGINKIALEQRWAAIFSLGSSVSAVVVLLMGGGVLALILTNQVWQLINVGRNLWLVRNCSRILELPVADREERKSLIHMLWPQSWRAFLGVFGSAGLIHLSGFVYARLASPAELAAYMLGLRLIQMISQFSRAPFYSRIPILNRMRAQGDIQGLVKLAKHSMQLSYGVYLVPWAVLLFFGDGVMELLGSQTGFPSALLWLVLGIAILLERIGAMHIQIYSTTNHIVWHIANGVTGVLMVLLFYPLHELFGVLGLPLSMAVAYGGFYVWYSMMLSLRSIERNFFEFEALCSIPSVVFVATIGVIAMWVL